MAPIVIKSYPHIYKWNDTPEAVSSCVSHPGGKKNALIENSRNFIKIDHFQAMVI